MREGDRDVILEGSGKPHFFDRPKRFIKEKVIDEHSPHAHERKILDRITRLAEGPEDAVVTRLARRLKPTIDRHAYRLGVAQTVGEVTTVVATTAGAYILAEKAIPSLGNQRRRIFNPFRRSARRPQEQTQPRGQAPSEIATSAAPSISIEVDGQRVNQRVVNTYVAVCQGVFPQFQKERQALQDFIREIFRLTLMHDEDSLSYAQMGSRAHLRKDVKGWEEFWKAAMKMMYEDVRVPPEKKIPAYHTYREQEMTFIDNWFDVERAILNLYLQGKLRDVPSMFTNIFDFTRKEPEFNRESVVSQGQALRS